MVSYRTIPALIAGGLLVCLTTASSLQAQSASTSIVTGTCKDGSKTTAAHRQGACRGHGGVATWASTAGTGSDTAAAAMAAPAPRTPAAKPAASKTTTTPAAPATTTAGAAPASATGMCKDGSYTKAAHHSGACAHHGGVKQWLPPTSS